MKLKNAFILFVFLIIWRNDVYYETSVHREVWEMTADQERVCLVDACGQVSTTELSSKKFCVHSEENVGWN